MRCQLPDVWGEQLHQRGEMKHSCQEKGTKLKRILRQGYRLSLLLFSFLTLCCPLWWEEGVNQGGGHTAPAPNVPIWTKKTEAASRGGHQGCPNINYTFVHSWLTLGWPRLTPEWKRSSESSPLPQPIPGCQQTAHGPLTHCQPNETSALMKPLWALLVRQQRAMKTLTIHFMDWAVVRTDNMGLINETGLVSWRKGGTQKCNWWRIQAKSEGLVSCWWWRTLRPPGKKRSTLTERYMKV